jgi:hypothetical protein
MTAESQPRPLPPELSLDKLTWYIYGHFSHLLTDEERAAHRIWSGHVKQFDWKGPSRSGVLEMFNIPQTEATYPELSRQIRRLGLARVMRAAAERVLRDNPEKAILHTCPKCRALCRTPKAQQCFDCGFDWHSSQGD